MSSNLFVSFDIRDISREPGLVLAAIEELGQAVRIFGTFWFVRTNLTAAEAAKRVWEIMQTADQLMVIDASRQEVAAFNIEPRCVDSMARRWHLELEVPAPPSANADAAPGDRAAAAA
jgi:hypothetical protein